MCQRLVLLAAALFAAAPAAAANRRSFFFGGEAARTAGALIGATHDAGALFYNPAGLAGLPGDRLNLSLTAFNLRLQKVPRGLVVQLPAEEAAEDLTGTEVNPVPASLLYARRSREGLGFAYGVLVTDATDLRFDGRVSRSGVTDPSLPGPVDVATGLNAQQLSTSYLFGAGLGLRVSPDLALGASLFVSYGRDIVYAQLFSSATLQGNSSFYVVTTSEDIKVLGLLPVLSAVWTPLPGLDAGLTLRPLHVSLYTWGERAPLAAGPGITTGQVFGAEREEVGEALVTPLAPPSAEVMLAYSLDRFQAGATLEVVLPVEATGTLPIETGLQWNVRLGASVQLSEDLLLGAGFYTDRHVESGEGIDYQGFTLGLGTRTGLDTAGTVFFTNTFAAGYALGVGTIENFRVLALGGPSDIDTGAVEAAFHELTFNVASGLEF